MSLFRSAPMRYYELYIPSEEAYTAVSKVAPEKFVEFIDAAPNNFHKPFYNDIRRCEDVLIKIDNILKQVRKYNLPLPDMPDIERIFSLQEQFLEETKETEQAMISSIESEVEQSFKGIEKSIETIQNSQRKIVDLQDYKYLLFKAREIFSSKNRGQNQAQEIDFSRTTLEQLRLVNISGVILARDQLKFGKMILRATKGHSICYTFNIPQDQIELTCPHLQIEPRVAFIVIIESGANVKGKVTRICQSFSNKLYTLETSKDAIFEKIKDIENCINDTKQMCAMVQKKLKVQLESAVQIDTYQCAKYEAYRVLIEKQAIIYQTLNLLKVVQYENKPGSTMIAKVWVPEDKCGRFEIILPTLVTVRHPETQEKPPTFFETNSFTAPFQEIVDTYGVPRYQEVNPGIFAIAIFPFLFGVMFGDIGHGGVLLAFGIWLVKDPNAKKILGDVYDIRYLVLMMGSFAFYSGWIYNEFFSIPWNVFGSCYGEASHEEQAEKIEGCVYPFGMDPKWIRASNELNYFNSYKMKFAVIIGVTQMTLAIFLKCLNTLYWKNYIDLFFEWLPQQIFFFCTFGYMCILIIAKWTIPWGFERDTAVAPSIIGQMIALPLKVGSTQGKPLWDMQFQENLQYRLLMISLICVPWMLIFKPLILWSRMPPRPRQPSHSQSNNPKKNSDNDLKAPLILESDLNEVKKKGDKKEENNLKAPLNLESDLHEVKKKAEKEEHGHGHDEHDISEIAVHQIIETIEFVLGTISNTASYLRLWALSLAHGQLSRVFLEKTIGGGIVSGNAIIILIGMYFFVSITVGVILGMDSMECFLHALRLQWVEFNSKFFKADGRKFTPLNLSIPIKKSLLALRTVE